MSAVVDTQVYGVSADDVDLLWNEVVPLIEQAMEYADGKLTADDVYMAIKDREMQLWIVPGGVWVTQIMVYPQSTRLEGIAASGEWRDWMKHADDVIEWARAQGCDAVELTGRPGWGRKTGFEEIHRTFRVRI